MFSNRQVEWCGVVRPESFAVGTFVELGPWRTIDELKQGVSGAQVDRRGVGRLVTSLAIAVVVQSPSGIPFGRVDLLNSRAVTLLKQTLAAARAPALGRYWPG